MTTNIGGMLLLDDMIPSSSSQQQQQHQLHSRLNGNGTTTTSSSTISVNNTITSCVDDAKYDRRIKQRLLLRKQRKLRRQNLIQQCATIVLPISIVLFFFIGTSFYFMNYYISTSSLSESRPFLPNQKGWVNKHQKKTPEQVIHHPIQQDHEEHHQEQRAPPVPLEDHPQYVNNNNNNNAAVDRNDDESPKAETTLDKVFEQLRTLFVWKNKKQQQRILQSFNYKAKKLIPKKQRLLDTLELWLHQEHDEIQDNVELSHPRWIRPYLLPPVQIVIDSDGNSDVVPVVQNRDDIQEEDYIIEQKKMKKNLREKKIILPEFKASQVGKYFRVDRFTTAISNNVQSAKNKISNSNKMKLSSTTMKWQDEYDALLQQYGSRSKLPGPIVDYTNPDMYQYPSQLVAPPKPNDPVRYPPLQSLEQIMTKWPQNEDYNIESNGKIIELLQHFDYQNKTERAIGILFRDAELPFKFYNVPEILHASNKWTDEYVGQMFGNNPMSSSGILGGPERVTVTMDDGTTIKIPTARGTAQESRDNYFAFYVAKNWDVEIMGLAPTRNIQDWNYTTWSNHAVYADAVRLPYNKPHFYWQSGIPPDERHLSEKYWTFISRDLPIFSSPTDNVFVFHVDQQKGIQCRFGERGVVAATHYDCGRNMVAMISGAKRYILSPPNQCSKLGIFTKSHSPIYRHSLLNFGHIQYLKDKKGSTLQEQQQDPTQMSIEEQAWLRRAASSQAVETVLKKGEVLYIPSHWFHYIVSLQKSAQCNVRSGVDVDGTNEFGGRHEVETCVDE